MGMLDNMTDWVKEAPPQSQSNQRFGNLAFREYIRLVNEVWPILVIGQTGRADNSAFTENHCIFPKYPIPTTRADTPSSAQFYGVWSSNKTGLWDGTRTGFCPDVMVLRRFELDWRRR